MNAAENRRTDADFNRLDELTALRGFAAVWVVFLHAMYEWNAVFRSGARFTNLITGAGLWVHFFFLLSGFVITYAYEKQFRTSISRAPYIRFMWVRLGRIYPLYLIVLLAWVALASVGWIGVRDPGRSLLASFFLVQGVIYGDDVWNYPGWSISAEWFAYCAFPFIALALGRVTGQSLRAVAAILVVSIVMLWGFGPSTSAQPASSVVYCLLEFSLGYVVCRMTLMQRLSRPLGRHTAAFICMLPVLFLALPPNPYSGWILGVATVCCALTIGLIATQDTSLGPFLRSRPMQFLGTISYSIYLLHALLFRTVKAAIDSLVGRPRVIPGLSSANALIAFAAYFVLLVLFAWLTYRTIEEPARLWFKRTGARIGSRVGPDGESLTADRITVTPSTGH